MPVWSRDRIANLSREDIENLRTNAVRHNQSDIVKLCDEELEVRKPPRPKKPINVSEDRAGQYVSEYHFVCPQESNVVRNPDGTIWSGTWVVAQERAEDSLRFGAVVALHVSKKKMSYLQGSIVRWKVSSREWHNSGDQLVQTLEGIDFLLKPTDLALPWQGRATGEKGYLWTPIPSQPKIL